jgi:Family of unknown function (DUF6153)
MNAIRSLMTARWTTHRVVFMVGLAVALILGMLAMHTSLAPGGGHGHSVISASATTDHGQTEPGITMGASAIDAPPCADDGCGTSGMPDHSMLLMMCAMALLVVVIAVVSAALITQSDTSRTMSALLRQPTRAIPSPRPPSLLVLSISRT